MTGPRNEAPFLQNVHREAGNEAYSKRIGRSNPKRMGRTESNRKQRRCENGLICDQVTEDSFAGKLFNQANFKGKVGPSHPWPLRQSGTGTAWDSCHLAGHHEAMPRGSVVL